MCICSYYLPSNKLGSFLQLLCSMRSVVTMKNRNVFSEEKKSVVNILDNVFTKGEVKGSALPKSVGVDLILRCIGYLLLIWI